MVDLTLKDPRTVSPEEKERTIKLARQIFKNFMRQNFSPDETRELSRRIDALRHERQSQPQPVPAREHLAESVAQIRTPEEEAAMQKLRAEVLAYRGTGRRG